MHIQYKQNATFSDPKVVAGTLGVFSQHVILFTGVLISHRKPLGCLIFRFSFWSLLRKRCKETASWWSGTGGKEREREKTTQRVSEKQ